MVAAGDALLAPSVTKRLIEAFAARPLENAKVIESLTAREREVLRGIGRGLSNHDLSWGPPVFAHQTQPMGCV
ncbi:MAG: hypothetical protein ABR609_06645 [Acidimicrobiia bacterium]